MHTPVGIATICTASARHQGPWPPGAHRARKPNERKATGKLCEFTIFSQLYYLILSQLLPENTMPLSLFLLSSKSLVTHSLLVIFLLSLIEPVVVPLLWPQNCEQVPHVNAVVASIYQMGHCPAEHGEG